MSVQLALFFNQCFASGIFLPILETSKTVPTYQKGSKLEYSNYKPISLLSNIDNYGKTYV